MSHSWKGEEFIAWLRGEEVNHSDILDVLLVINRDTYDLLVNTIPTLIQNDFTFICKDGEVIYHSKASLMRRFHLLDDYLSDFPDEMRMTMPFTTDEVSRVLEGGRLLSCYECLCHFNPKDVATYFEYSTIGMNPDILLSIHSRLTERNKRDIMEARRFSTTFTYPLPDEGFGRGTLAQILDYHGDDASLLHLFSDYPSYLTFALSDNSERNKLLLTANYNREEYGQPNCIERVYSIIHDLIEYVTNLDDEERIQAIRRMVAMMNIRDPIFENTEIVNCMPYNMLNLIELESSTQWKNLAMTMHEYISSELGLDSTEVKNVLERIMK